MTFTFLGETHRVPEGRWAADSSLLWHYNLHYFDDLNASGAQSRRALHGEAIASWIRNNPPTEGVGWAPYPMSLRTVNWIKWSLAGGTLDQAMIGSLAVQARAMRSRLEYHLLGNHLFANAKALAFAGTFFDGPEAEGWLEKGLGILEREIPEQILADGGQFERSPMYHALALEDVVDLVNLFCAFPESVPERWRPLVASWPDVARRMHAWMRAMCHPDGEIAFFNDAAIGIAPAPAELERYAGEVLGQLPRREELVPAAPRVVRLPDSGYLRVEVPEAVFLVDVAPVGPAYLPGHAHADTLSFELSVFGQRVVVNRGTSRYGLGPEREAERGTPAHSTVTVDGEDSSEVWAGFRVARRAVPSDLVVSEQAGSVEVACSHDGYRRLKGTPVHRRCWLAAPGLLRVEDYVEGGVHAAVARFHLHPSIAIVLNAWGTTGELRLPDDRSIRWRVEQGDVRIEESVYCPEFGRRVPTKCLAIELVAGKASCIEFSW